MNNKDRQQKINELKTLRAELLAIKEIQDGESGEGNADNEALKLLRREYMTESEQSIQESDKYKDVRRDVYEQYGHEENLDNSQQKTLVRRR